MLYTVHKVDYIYYNKEDFRMETKFVRIDYKNNPATTAVSQLFQSPRCHTYGCINFLTENLCGFFFSDISVTFILYDTWQTAIKV